MLSQDLKNTLEKMTTKKNKTKGLHYFAIFFILNKFI